MDWVESFNEGKPTKDERRIHRELTTAYKCPGCKQQTIGLRHFSDHKRECNRFNIWLHKHKKSYAARWKDTMKRPFNPSSFQD